MLDENLDIFFKDIFQTQSHYTPIVEVKSSYPHDIKKSGDNLIFEIAAIGLNNDDIKVNVVDDTLFVEYKSDNKKSTDEYIYKCLARRNFNLSWKISKSYDLTQLTAKLKKGLLTITVPISKEEKAKSFSVEIN